MKTSDIPFLRLHGVPYKNYRYELRRCDDRDDTVLIAETIDGEVGYWIVQKFRDHPEAKLNSDVVNADLELLVGKRQGH